MLASAILMLVDISVQRISMYYRRLEVILRIRITTTMKQLILLETENLDLVARRSI